MIISTDSLLRMSEELPRRWYILNSYRPKVLICLGKGSGNGAPDLSSISVNVSKDVGRSQVIAFTAREGSVSR